MLTLLSRHHHHHIDDEAGNALRKAGNSATPVPRRHHLHHHHHHPDGTIHYHSHNKSSSSKTLRIPVTKVNNEPILESIRHLPRKHLGSVLYSPAIKAPSPMEPEVDSMIAPFTIPRYDGKENCTITVRIPRFYLTKDHREQVTLGRAVWGTDIYSDDSDPLTAAIHAGWIRGDWGDGIDFSMLEITPATNEPTKHDNNSETIITSLPPLPLLPPPNKDLHITLLILPTLQQYTSHISHGIKSRAWGADHDGLSFRIEKIQWVDEKLGRGEERDGEARRKRLRMTREASLMGPALKLAFKTGARAVNGVVTAAA